MICFVGHGRITPRQVPFRNSPKEEQRVEERKPQTSATKPKDPSDAVSNRGVDGVLTRYAQCCNPLPGDPIVGYISRGLGVTIHTQDCPNVANMEVDRLIDVSWSGDEQKVLPARIRVIAKNQRGMLGQICTLLSEEGVNIDSGEFNSTLDGKTEMDF